MAGAEGSVKKEGPSWRGRGAEQGGSWEAQCHKDLKFSWVICIVGFGFVVVFVLFFFSMCSDAWQWRGCHKGMR